MSNQENLGKNIKEIFQDKYVIPLYQRNYAWREDEIVQLLQDIFVTFKRSNKTHYYIGSLVVLKRHNGAFEVIDGQQRLTTLSLLVRLLECYQYSVLSYDSRPIVEDFFDVFYKNPDSISALSSPEIFYLKEAVHIIKETAISNGQEQVQLLSWQDKNTFADFLMNNVYLVRVEIPEDTDVASYFEIMNNRGEQLQKHEIVKSLMMAKLKNSDKQNYFAKIWDACSQMNIPIQRIFLDVKERKKFFGENYDSFNKEAFNIENSLNYPKDNSRTLDEILNDNTATSKEEIFPSEDPDEYHSIIDWSNFLMHILKLYDDSVQLNEKFLLDGYNELASKTEFDPWDFVQTLLYCRTVFDRFVVKTEHNPGMEDDFLWLLSKPTIRDNNQLDYISSFQNNNEQDKLVKVLSMLQVTYRTRVYKNWLFELLQWFYDNGNKKDLTQVQANDLIKVLNNYVLNRYEELQLTLKNVEQVNANYNWDGTYCEGTRTPHFLFNFIDYLYWLKKDDYNFKDFDFKYWNSVEHHLARNKAANISGADQYIDNLGNLCLISKSSNSRLSDRLPQEKIEFYGNDNLGPNRQRIYAKCKNDNFVWGEEQIGEHYNEIICLLESAKDLLSKNMSAPK